MNGTIKTITARILYKGIIKANSKDALPRFFSPIRLTINANPIIAKLLLKLPWTKTPLSSGGIFRNEDSIQLKAAIIKTITIAVEIKNPSKASVIFTVEILRKIKDGNETLKTNFEICEIKTSLIKLIFFRKLPRTINKKIGATIFSVKSIISLTLIFLTFCLI